MAQAVELARKAAASRATVLLLGESGSGKEIFARAIHVWSERRHEPFIAINCVGLSRELLESELFGHEKGAFTGAHRLKKGKLELAHRGSVLLDEVGDISQELQTKLLRFLQERDVRAGGRDPADLGGRADHRGHQPRPGRAVKEGRFREDLYHRLNVIPITLPPLRERREDILDLARVLPGSLRAGDEEALHRDRPGGAGAAAHLRLAGERPRAGQRDRARRRPRSRAGHHAARSAPAGRRGADRNRTPGPIRPPSTPIGAS